MEQAAKSVHAKLLVVISPEDHMVNPTPALAFAAMTGAANWLNRATMTGSADAWHRLRIALAQCSWQTEHAVRPKTHARSVAPVIISRYAEGEQSSDFQGYQLSSLQGKGF